MRLRRGVVEAQGREGVLTVVVIVVGVMVVLVFMFVIAKTDIATATAMTFPPFPPRVFQEGDVVGVVRQLGVLAEAVQVTRSVAVHAALRQQLLPLLISPLPPPVEAQRQCKLLVLPSSLGRAPVRVLHETLVLLVKLRAVAHGDARVAIREAQLLEKRNERV